MPSSSKHNTHFEKDIQTICVKVYTRIDKCTWMSDLARDQVMEHFHDTTLDSSDFWLHRVLTFVPEDWVGILMSKEMQHISYLHDFMRRTRAESLRMSNAELMIDVATSLVTLSNLLGEFNRFDEQQMWYNLALGCYAEAKDIEKKEDVDVCEDFANKMSFDYLQDAV